MQIWYKHNENISIMSDNNNMKEWLSVSVRQLRFIAARAANCPFFINNT